MKGIFMKRIKYIAQIQQTECGLCVITMLLNYYGAHYSLYDVRRLVDVGRDGMSVKEVFGTLEGFGIHAEAFRCKDVRDLRQLKTPFILALKKKHLVIVEKISKHAVYTVDPAVGRVKYSFEELLTVFDGICIEAVPGVGFQKKRNEHKMFQVLFPLLREKGWKYFVFICLSFFNYFLMMGLLISMQKFVDGIYSGENSAGNIRIVFLFMSVYMVLAIFMKIYMADLKVAVDKKINIKVIHRLLNLPYIFFDTRKKSDILFTLNHVSYVREILVTDLLNIFMDIGILIVIWIYFFLTNRSMMIALNIVLVCNIFLALLSQKVMTNNMRRLVIENSKVQGCQTEILYAMFSIKSGCMEDETFSDWREKYTGYSKKYGSNEKISAIWGTILTVFQMLSPLIVLGTGVLLESGNIASMGKIVTLFSLAEIFFSQVYSFFNSALNIGMNSIYVERLGDIFFTEKTEGEERRKEIGQIHSIKADGLSFQYTKNEDYILRNISFEITKGECIAVAGKSGSGKSTLLKVVSGLYELSDGKIFVNGEDICEISKKNLVSQMGIVPQEAYLFNKSIRDNLVGDNESVSDKQIEEVLKAVCIYDEVIKMPMCQTADWERRFQQIDFGTFSVLTAHSFRRKRVQGGVTAHFPQIYFSRGSSPFEIRLRNPQPLHKELKLLITV